MWKQIIYPLLFLVIGGGNVLAQMPPNLPQRTPLVVSPSMSLMFGDFWYASGTNGSVTVSPSGVRTPGGNVFLLGGNVQQGQFEFNLLPGRIVVVRSDPMPPFQISSPNGGLINITNLLFELASGTYLERGNGYIRFRSNSGSNPLHRLYMGGTLEVDHSFPSNPGVYYNQIQLTIEAY
jgi:hypothetical protein